jgi:hypothetical protein
MQWTTEFPKEPGWYWMYDTLFSERLPEVVRCDAAGAVFDTYSGQVHPSPLVNRPYMFKGPIKQPSATKQAKACEASKSTQNA